MARSYLLFANVRITPDIVVFHNTPDSAVISRCLTVIPTNAVKKSRTGC